MTVSFGEHINLELYGTSHGPCIGVRISGLPAGISFDPDRLQDFLDRRAPGRNAWSTARKEADRPVFRTGVAEGSGKRLVTTGQTLTAEIMNTNTRPGDYQNTAVIPRPAHADYPAWVKYGRIESGGGQFSARLTAALCIAGGIFLQWLEEKDIRIGAHIRSIGAVQDAPFDPLGKDADGGADPFAAVDRDFPVIRKDRGEAMKSLIAGVKGDGDSIGGVIECMITGLPAGMGSPLFGSIESRLCQVLFAVPAVKGVEFGAGFQAAGMLGSENNDPYRMEDGRVVTSTNHHGGILGGLSSGMPVIFRTAMKPTPSIAKEQKSVDLNTLTETVLQIRGRHDPCIVPRAVPCIEAAAAVAVADLLLEQEEDREERTKACEDQSAGACEKKGADLREPQGAGQQDLARYRIEIDRIDREIMRLMEERFDVVTEIGAWKERQGLPVLDEKREQQKIAAMKALVSEEKGPYLEGILKGIMAESRNYQEDRKKRNLSEGTGRDQAGTDGDQVEAAADPAPIFGLLGRVLGHSHSPQVHRMLAGYEYGLFEREPDQLAAFFADPFWRGINVTIPYKKEVMAYCDELSQRAADCASVNTIVRRTSKDGGETTFGDNTDYAGFRYMVEQAGIDVSGSKALVLGSGGVSGTVVCALRDLGADPVIVISRSGENNYQNLDRHRDARIIVNTTPVGMYPRSGEAAVDIREFPACAAVFDLIYNPLRTRLMLDAEAAGIPAFGGLSMLVAQAAEASALFLDASGAGEEKMTEVRERTDAVFRRLQSQLEDLVLIGMPGAGKTSVGRLLAEQTGRGFLDLDEEIGRQTGRSPEEIIREDGPDRFREIETQILRRVVRREGNAEGNGLSENCGGPGSLVIACGGGIVEREENRALLRENGRVIWVQRPLTELPVSGRPISQNDGVEEIYRRRAGRYEDWSDMTADAPDVAGKARQIMQKLGLPEQQDR